MPWPTEEARFDLEALAEDHGLHIVWRDGMPQAHPQHRTVWLNHPADGERYLGDLHEMGHCLDPDAVAKYELCCKPAERNNRRQWFLMEAAAWSWALAHVHPDLHDRLTKRDWLLAGQCLFSYAKDIAAHPARPWVR